MTQPEGHGALLSFSTRNVRSFREEAKLSMVATRLSEDQVPRHVTWGERGADDILPSAGLFGANASGKSNLLRAMSDMRQLVLHSFRSGSSGSGLRRAPFRLDQVSSTKPSAFDIDVVVDGQRFQYGFEVDDQRVVSEYAFHFPNGRQARVFERDGDDLILGSPLKREARSLKPLLRDNALLLSVTGASRSSFLLPLYEWFGRNLWHAEVSTRATRTVFTAQLLNDPSRRQKVLDLLRAADLGIDDIRLQSLDEDTMERMRRAVRVLNGLEGDAGADVDEMLTVVDDIRLRHCSNDQCVEFEPSEESLGTLVWVGFVGPVIDALARGSVLLADELDASLHPHLVQQIIRLFQSSDTNPRGSQLIFNAHDATLLESTSPRLLGRDQVWMTEKGADGSTTLYALSDFSPRRDDSIEMRYLRGSYGATPRVHFPEFARALRAN